VGQQPERGRTPLRQWLGLLALLSAVALIGAGIGYCVVLATRQVGRRQAEIRNLPKFDPERSQRIIKEHRDARGLLPHEK
jgi:hypothetical protein